MTRRLGDKNWRELLGKPTGAMPRVSRYGGQLAAKMGLLPLGDSPDELVKPADFKEVINECNEKQIFPEYHQRATWCPDGQPWNQDGLNYCWAWGCTSATMDCRAAEGKPTVQLAPVSLGWLVSWRNAGYFLDATINGAMEKGIAPASAVPGMHSRNPSSFADDWQTQALLYRPKEWWDTDKTSDLEMIRQCLTILKTGRSLYIAYNWWSHALNCCGMLWDESEPNNVVWRIRNSHNETEPIELTGSRGVPDEAYGVRATLDTGV